MNMKMLKKYNRSERNLTARECEVCFKITSFTQTYVKRFLETMTCVIVSKNIFYCSCWISATAVPPSAPGLRELFSSSHYQCVNPFNCHCLSKCFSNSIPGMKQKRPAPVRGLCVSLQLQLYKQYLLGRYENL